MSNFWIKLKRPMIGLAPMDGVTDYPMRQIQCSVTKPDVMYTEFIQAEGFSRNQKVFRQKLTFDKNEHPIVAQVVGVEPEAFYKTVKIIAGMGFDGIDINMGCPNKDVVSRGAGGGLIGNEKIAGEIIEQCLLAINDSGVNLPLSVKTRIGKDKSIIKSWITFLSKFPLSEVTIHGRLLKQFHSGKVDWEEIEKGAKILRYKDIKCLGNGGVKTVDESQSLSQRYGLDGVLIGQAAWGNPWVFGPEGKPTKREILDIILKHGHLAWDFFGEKKYVSVLKHYSWYPRSFKGAKQLRIDLVHTRKIEEVEKIIKRYSK